jgi:hypothetical protein
VGYASLTALRLRAHGIAATDFLAKVNAVRDLLFRMQWKVLHLKVHEVDAVGASGTESVFVVL